MGLAIGTRAVTVNKFWAASRAWYDRDGSAEGWNFEQLISELRMLTKIVGPVANQADALLQLVIEDKPEREPCENSLHQIHCDRLAGRRVEYIIIDEWADFQASK